MLKEWQEVYNCLAELEEEYCSLLQESEEYQPMSEAFLMKRRAKLYEVLAALESHSCWTV